MEGPEELGEVQGPQEPNLEEPVIEQPVFEFERWAKIIVCLCFAAATEIALVSAQLQYHLLPIFHFLSLSILFGFVSLFISKVINTEFPNTARVLQAASVFFVVTAFFVAISIPFPLSLKLTVFVVYVVCLNLVVLTLYNRFYR